MSGKDRPSVEIESLFNYSCALSLSLSLSIPPSPRASVSMQSELISCGGLHVLLSLLSGSTHCSTTTATQACDDELSKAVTFVLQCCLPHQQQQQVDANNCKRIKEISG